MNDAFNFKVDVNQESLRKIAENLGRFEHHLARNLATAVNRTARTVGVEAAQQLGKVVNFKLHSTNKHTSKTYTKAKVLKKAVIRKNIASPDNPQVTIKLWKGHPFPARWHEAMEYAKTRKGKRLRSGVRYKTNMGGGWTSVLDGFIVRQWGGHVYKREEGGRKLRKIFGKSPGDYFTQTSIASDAARIAAERLPIEIKRRLREVTLAAEGKIKLRTSPELGTN
jgi:hypothetical protein